MYLNGDNFSITTIFNKHVVIYIMEKSVCKVLNKH